MALMYVQFVQIFVVVVVAVQVVTVGGQYYWPFSQRTFMESNPGFLPESNRGFLAESNPGFQPEINSGFLPEKCPLSCRCSKIRQGHELLGRWQKLTSPSDEHILENAIEQGHRFRRDFSFGSRTALSGRDMMCMGLREMPSSLPTDIVRLSMFGEEVSPATNARHVTYDQLNRPSSIRARGTSLQTSNQLAAINKSAFRRNSNLMELSIVGNDVRYISPGEFEYLPNLVSLNLKNNNLKSLQPRTFRGLVQLEELSLSKNDLYELPIDILDDVPMLRKLSLDGNHLRSLQIDAFRFLHQLNMLDLSSNNLTYLPRSLFYGNTNLTELNVDDNLLEDIRSDWFSQAARLKKLSMSRNKLSHLDPESMTALQSLTELHLSGNQISRISHRTFFHTTNLKNLDLSDNLISSLDSGTFRRSKALRELNLSGNKLVVVRADLFGPSSALQMLDLSMNKIKTLIKENFFSLKQLEKLDLSHNDLDYIANGTFLGLRKLRELNLAQNKISVVDTSSFSVSLSRYVSQLTWLSLQHNSLNNISDDTFRTVPHLKFLNVAFNKIRSISQDSFASQKQLNTLLMNNNLISAIPNGVFSSLKNARDLNLGYNQLRALSNSALKGLLRLNELNVQRNRLTQVSASVLGEVPSLTRANFSGNSLHYINMDIFAKNMKLSHLDLSWNVLSRIKVSVKNGVKLSHLSLMNNKLKTLHSEISGLMASEGVLALENNTWNCDCHLSWLKFLVPIWQLSLHNGGLLECHQPRKFFGKKVLSLTQSQFLCNSKGSDSVESIGSSALRPPAKESFGSRHQQHQKHKNLNGSGKQGMMTQTNKPNRLSTPKPQIYSNPFLTRKAAKNQHKFPFVTSTPTTQTSSEGKRRRIHPKPNLVLSRRKSFGQNIRPVVNHIWSTESPKTTNIIPITTSFPDLRLNWWKTWTLAPKPVTIRTTQSPYSPQIPQRGQPLTASRVGSNSNGNRNALKDYPYSSPDKPKTASARSVKPTALSIIRPTARTYYQDTLNRVLFTSRPWSTTPLRPRAQDTTSRFPITLLAQSTKLPSYYNNQHQVDDSVSKWWIPRPIYPTSPSQTPEPTTTPDPRAKYGKLQYHRNSNTNVLNKDGRRRPEYLPTTNRPNVLVTTNPTNKQDKSKKLRIEIGRNPSSSNRFSNINSYNVIPVVRSLGYSERVTVPRYLRRNFATKSTRRPAETTTHITPFKKTYFSTPPKVFTLPSTAIPGVVIKPSDRADIPTKSRNNQRSKQKNKSSNTRKLLRAKKVNLDCPTKSEWRMHFDKALIRRHKSEVKDFHVTILNSRRKPACNAVLLSDWWILTSASCAEENLASPGKLRDPAWVPNLNIKIGQRELNKVVGIAVHPLYLSHKSPEHNFAVLKLKYDSLMTKVVTPPCVLPPDWFQGRPAWVVPGVASARFDSKKPRSDLQTLSVKVWETDCATNPVSCLRIQNAKLTASSAFTDGAPLYLGYSESRWSLVGIGTSAQGKSNYGKYLPVWIVLDWLKTVINA